MTILEIFLLIIGIFLIIGSFFVTEKLSEADIEELKKLSRDQIESIIKDKMADAKVDMEDILKKTIDEAMEELDRKTDKETNEKIMQISEYSDTVLESVNKSHNEVVFMYSMLNEKQTAVTEMTKDLQKIESDLKALDSSVIKKLESAKEMNIVKDNEAALDIMAAQALAANPVIEKPASISDELKKQFQPETTKNGNLEILSLHDQGMSEVDIAKKLGRGLGEVKFVLGLYQED